MCSKHASGALQNACKHAVKNMELCAVSGMNGPLQLRMSLGHSVYRGRVANIQGYTGV